MVYDLDELAHWIMNHKIEPKQEIQINDYQTGTVDLIREANIERSKLNADGQVWVK